MNEEILHPQEETVAKSAVNIAFKWALISLLIHVIYTMAMISMNDGKYNPNASGLIHYVVLIFSLFFPITMCIREYRDKEMDSFISFGKAFKTGFVYSLITIVLVVFFQFILYNFIIDWDVFVADQVDVGIERMKKQGMSDEQIQKGLSSTPEFVSTQWFSLAIVAVMSLIMYTISNLIVSAILKRNRPANA